MTHGEDEEVCADVELVNADVLVDVEEAEETPVESGDAYWLGKLEMRSLGTLCIELDTTGDEGGVELFKLVDVVDCWLEFVDEEGTGVGDLATMEDVVVLRSLLVGVVET